MGRPRNPFRGVMDTMSEMARMREYAEGSGGQEEGRRTHATAWVPTTDIFAIGDDLVIRCELAGVRPDDVEISLSGGALTIDGERMGEPEASEHYTRECYYGHFRRRLKLPENLDASSVSASFENGLLEVIVRGGVDRHEPEQIEIKYMPAGETNIRTG
jgi:HSP20 family protein